MSKAEYTTDNIGHYGLAFTHYTHFTSPIRRYPDVMVHRLLQDYLEKKKSPPKTTIEEACKHASQREQLATRAERDSIKYMQMVFMEDKVGQEFEGVISGVTDRGMYVEIIENKCEGMIRMVDLKNDFFQYDMQNHAIVGETKPNGLSTWGPTSNQSKKSKHSKTLFGFYNCRIIVLFYTMQIRRYVLLFFFASLSLWSQDTEKKILAISPFQGLKVYSNLDVELISSDVNKVIAYGENSDFVVLSLKEGILKIRISGGSLLTPGKTKIELYHSRPLDQIHVYQESQLTASTPLEQTSLSLEAKTNAVINLEIQADRLDTKASLGGRIFLKGKVTNHEILITSSGLCEAEELITQQTKTKSYGGAYSLYLRKCID